MLTRDRRARHLDGVELDHEGGAVVLDGEQSRSHALRVQIQFLGQLAAGGHLMVLALVDLAAGELPQAPVTLVRGTQPEEEPTLAFDDGSDDANPAH